MIKKTLTLDMATRITGWAISTPREYPNTRGNTAPMSIITNIPEKPNFNNRTYPNFGPSRPAAAATATEPTG